MQYKARLRQLTAMCVSGSDMEPDYLDNWFYRDGRNRLCIPGTTLAGVFIQTARELGILHDDMYDSVTSKGLGKSQEQVTSQITFFHLHHPNDTTVSTEVRQMTAIDSATHSAVQHSLFAVEVTPPGTIWNMKIETNNESLQKIIEQVLWFWKNNYGFIGAMTTRGLGQFSLEEVKKYDRMLSCNYSFNHYLILKYEVFVGECEDGYGIDSLHIGGSSYSTADFSQLGSFVRTDHINDFKDLLLSCDNFPVVTCKEGRLQPVIPGSSIKGAFRALAEKRGTSEEDTKFVFGTVDKQKKQSKKGVVFFPDLLPEDSYSLIYMEKHAEDEFTASTYGTAKYNQIDVLSAKFSGLILSKNETALSIVSDLIDSLPNGEVMLGSGGSFVRIKMKEDDNA